VTQHRKCPIFIIFLRRNIEKNSIELISKCAKTRLHQCRIKNWHPGPLLQRGEGRRRGRGNGKERGREAGRWKATGITHQFRLKSCTALFTNHCMFCTNDFKGNNSKFCPLPITA